MTYALSDDVSIPCSQHMLMKSEWDMITALLGGTYSMRCARQNYLPQWQGEDSRSYDYRVRQSYLYNYYKRSIKALVGKPFSSPLIAPKTFPSELKDVVDDFDLQGNDITIFCKQWFEDALSYGHSFCLIDWPNTGEANLSRAQQKQYGIRPYAVHVPAHQVLGWKTAKIGGLNKLTQIRIRQPYYEEVGEFSETDTCIIRVYDCDPETSIVSWRVFKSQEDGAWGVINQGILKGQSEIPIVCLYSNKKDFFMSDPPLVDLAYLNIAHWQTTSDYRHIIHIQAVPILMAIGWGTNELPSTVQIGPNRLLVAASPDSNLKYVEHSGVALTGLQNYIDKLEDQMSAMAIKLLAEQRPGGVTATEVLVDSSAAETSLKSMAHTLDDAIEQVIYHMMVWLGLDTRSEIPEWKTNKDFGLQTGNDSIANWLLKANAQGIISKETAGSGAKKIGYLDADLDLQDELIRIQQEKDITSSTDLSFLPQESVSTEKQEFSVQEVSLEEI